MHLIYFGAFVSVNVVFCFVYERFNACPGRTTRSDEGIHHYLELLMRLILIHLRFALKTIDFLSDIFDEIVSEIIYI